MKRFCLILCCFMFFFTYSLSAKEVCKTSSNVKKCTNSDKDYYYENIYTYQDSALKKYKNITLTKMTKNKKITIIKDNKDYTQAGVFVKRYYYKNNTKGVLIKTITTTAHTNGKKHQTIQNNYTNKKLTYTLMTKFNNKGYQTYYFSTDTKKNKITISKQFDNLGRSTKQTKKSYDAKNKLKENAVTTYHSNGVKKKYVLKKYKKSNLYYELTKKINNKGYATYYYVLDTSSNKKVIQRKYSKVGKQSSETVWNYDKKNVLVKKSITSKYTNGKKSKVVTNNYKSKVITTKVNAYYKNNKKNNLYSKDTTYYNTKAKKTKKITNYYNSSSFKYIGYKDVRYDVKTNKSISGHRIQYYHGTKVKYYKTVYTYDNGKHIQSATNYYNSSGTRYQYNLKKYDTAKKLTYNLTTYYSSGKAYLKTGYTYQKSTYRYNRTEYSGGVKRLNDVTTYKNNTIVKTKYLREYYNSKGALIDKEEYVYTNGEISSSTAISGTKTTTAGSISKVYPVSKGVVTSPSWFYPASFGGGWHPGIDIGTYSVKNYGYAQPIKVINDATVIKRYNSCNSTNSSSCGDGFGNYVVVATKYKGKFYTILYAHQTKLSSSNKNHKAVLDQDKTGYKKNDVIGYVGSSGYSSGYHIHIQVQEHRYAKSITDIKERYKKHNKNTLFNVSYNNLGNNSDIFTVNPDVLFNLKYGKSW